MGDYPPSTQLPPWQGPRGLVVAASSLNAWIKLDQWWFEKGEPRAIHLDIVAAAGEHWRICARAILQPGYSDADEASADGLLIKLPPLPLKRASVPAGVLRDASCTHRMAKLPIFEQHPDLP